MNVLSPVWTPTKDYKIVRAQVLLPPTSASLRLKVPVEFSRDVSKLSRWFLRYIPIEIGLLKIKLKRKYAKIILILKLNEPITLSSDEISLELTILYSQTRSELRLKTKLHEFSDFNWGFATPQLRLQPHLRFSSTVQTSRVHHNSIYAR